MDDAEPSGGLLLLAGAASAVGAVAWLARVLVGG